MNPLKPEEALLQDFERYDYKRLSNLEIRGIKEYRRRRSDDRPI